MDLKRAYLIRMYKAIRQDTAEASLDIKLLKLTQLPTSRSSIPPAAAQCAIRFVYRDVKRSSIKSPPNPNADKDHQCPEDSAINRKSPEIVCITAKLPKSPVSTPFLASNSLPT